jgi:hypothetical protein
MTDQPQPLILASSSPFRRELLGKLRLSFQHHSPDIDERARPRNWCCAWRGTRPPPSPTHTRTP